MMRYALRHEKAEPRERGPCTVCVVRLVYRLESSGKDDSIDWNADDVGMCIGIQHGISPIMFVKGQVER